MTRTAVGEYDKCMLSFLNNCHHYSFLFQWKTFRVASCILLPWPICFVSSSCDFLSDSRRHPRLLLDISSPNFTLCIVHFSLSLTKFWVESNGEAADLPFSFPCYQPDLMNILKMNLLPPNPIQQIPEIICKWKSPFLQRHIPDG